MSRRAPRGCDPTPPAGGKVPGRARVYARGRRHSREHLYAERSPQYGSREGWDAAWAGYGPCGHVPPTGRAPAPIGDRPVGPVGLKPGPEQAYSTYSSANKEPEKTGGGPTDSWSGWRRRSSEKF